MSATSSAACEAEHAQREQQRRRPALPSTPPAHVIAVEPSDAMAAQRPRELAPALRASAESLPLRDGSVDAAMHPERVLDESERNATSGFAPVPPAVVNPP